MNIMEPDIRHNFTTELKGDIVENNIPRQVVNAHYSYVIPRIPTRPVLVHAASNVAAEIGLSEEYLCSQAFLEIFSGATVMANTRPYAMCYGGHQFGQWAGQLGDGRAINLFEVVHNQRRWTLQLKGAGRTPYSRSGDGLAVLRSSIREHLCSEAMHALGVPTTRSLSLMLTGDEVLRDMLYDGHPAYEKGAVVCRVAPSFIRFGNFQIFAARKDMDSLQMLADYTIKYFFPSIIVTGKEKYVQFFKIVTESTLDMIIHWQRVGFVHGVMNTDNMSIHGLTIDYGPYGWMDNYDPDWTPNTTDKEQRRYRFGNQPDIAYWNILQLANALYPLVEDAAPFEEMLADFEKAFEERFTKMYRAKLGLEVKHEDDAWLIDLLNKTMSLAEVDMTLFFRMLSSIKKDQYPQQILEDFQQAFYHPEQVVGEIKLAWERWFANYLGRLSHESAEDAHRKLQMNRVNPKFVLRNYMAQLAIDAAEEGDYSVLEELFTLLQQPYDEQPDKEKWSVKRPDWAKEKIGCSMLSCSS